jgi:hypothetical protein
LDVNSYSYLFLSLKRLRRCQPVFFLNKLQIYSNLSVSFPSLASASALSRVRPPPRFRLLQFKSQASSLSDETGKQSFLELEKKTNK